MKATTLLAVCILCTQSKLGSNFTGASSLALDSVIGIAVRHKQQVQEPEVCSDEEVFLRTHTASCDPNLGQRYMTSERIVISMETTHLMPEDSLDHAADLDLETRMGDFVLSSNEHSPATRIICNQIVHF